MTSLSAPAAKSRPTAAAPDLDSQVLSAIEEQVDCDVQFTCYRGSKQGSERAVYVLCDSKTITTLKEAYAGKPSRIEVLPVSPLTAEAEMKKATGAAFFSLNRSGYERNQIKAKHGTFKNAYDLWEGSFAKGYGNDMAAKAQFLRLIGAQEEGSSFRRTQKAAEKIQKAQEEVAQINRYQHTPGYGAF